MMVNKTEKKEIRKALSYLAKSLKIHFIIEFEVEK